MSSVIDSNGAVCYYSVLGICKHSTDDEIRCAYPSKALNLCFSVWILIKKWHPDRWIKDPKLALEAKKRFQHIQEAYSVLSNKRKRRIYDAGLFGLIGEDDDEDEKGMLEDLEGLLMDMMADSEEMGKSGLSWSSSTCPTKRTRIL
ncbi:DnaJ domain containing protein [Sesbania bispinosa]|nr:DnaJ domain containing protein [Sesbania bispinosa]